MTRQEPTKEDEERLTRLYAKFAEKPFVKLIIACRKIDPSKEEHLMPSEYLYGNPPLIRIYTTKDSLIVPGDFAKPIADNAEFYNEYSLKDFPSLKNIRKMFERGGNTVLPEAKWKEILSQHPWIKKYARNSRKFDNPRKVSGYLVQNYFNFDFEDAVPEWYFEKSKMFPIISKQGPERWNWNTRQDIVKRCNNLETVLKVENLGQTVLSPLGIAEGRSLNFSHEGNNHFYPYLSQYPHIRITAESIKDFEVIEKTV